ncbi:ALF repeat-containing protein [Streptomyces sp. NPDC059917]|uniref:ALF repeat-containing protein n=1 Tax=Streptomyces sp. NPDC059917 TaxID=3347002 RepID=UPI003665FE51
MKLTRPALALSVAALAPALLLATPSLAAAAPVTAQASASAVVGSDTENAAAIAKLLADPTTGKGVKREANKALDGTPADRAAFLETGLRLARAEDDRVAVARFLARPGISAGLRAAAETALGGTPEELRYFITVGQYQL